jgi:hypothetical protein
MSGTVLENVVVREYLRALSLECISLPVGQARELREQIVAHLDEALSPGATNAEVEAELARLGSARSVVAAAAGQGRRSIARRVLNPLGHIPWWAWAALAVLVAAAGTWSGFLISMKTAYPLTVIGSGWLYPVDQDSAVSTTAGFVTQTTVPARYHQRQGILLYVTNNSDWTQVILGVDPMWNAVVVSDVQVDVESGPHLNRAGEPHSTARYLSPGVIPPHSFRVVHLSWTTEMCQGPDGENITSEVLLRVRVGVITRTEDVGINQAFALAGRGPGGCP